MRTMRRLLLGSVMMFGAALATYAQAPAGAWSVNGNGYNGGMVIGAISATGTFGGFFLGDPIAGFWNAGEQKLTFWRSTGAGGPDRTQIYTAYMFPADHAAPNGSRRLAGYFESFTGTGATAARNVFGWYASQ